MEKRQKSSRFRSFGKSKSKRSTLGQRAKKGAMVGAVVGPIVAVVASKRRQRES